MNRNRKFLTIFAAGVLALAAGCASAPIGFVNGIMVGSDGMTLYTFDKDPAGSGKSVCNGPCAKNWPPLLAGANDKEGGYFSIITRDDGTKQWAYDGKPLYYFMKDAKPGDKTGDGFNGIWHVAQVAKREPPMSGGY